MKDHIGPFLMVLAFVGLVVWAVCNNGNILIQR